MDLGKEKKRTLLLGLYLHKTGKISNKLCYSFSLGLIHISIFGVQKLHAHRACPAGKLHSQA